MYISMRPQMDLSAAYLARDDVREALHLGAAGSGSGFSYSSSGPASITLYPSLVKQIRVLIYNGDADDCVPYKGNEEWTTRLADEGVLAEKAAWHPWMVDGDSIPAGYATTYTVSNATADVGEFAFLTIRLAGHMVPAFQPRAAASFFETWLAGGTF
jgi:carboxypeptidase C (cathepsin A)